MRRGAALILGLVGLVLLVGCGSGGTGGGNSTPTAAITSVAVSCTPASIQTGQTSQCSATVTGTGSYSSAVSWSVSPSSMGTISSTGAFTASAAGTATVTATSTQDSTISGTASVTVTATSSITSVSVTCSPSSITTAQTSNCSATAQGTGAFSSSVTWTATDGTITSSGVFTPSSTGTATIVATSSQDTTISGSSTVTVTTQEPTPTTPMVVPSILAASQQTQVTVTCFVRGADASTQVQLFSLAGGAPTLVGSMNDNGQNGDQTAGDKVYTIVTTLTPPAATSLPLQVVATEGTASSLNVNFSVQLAQIPTYATNIDVNQAESSIYNTAIQVRTSFPTTDWTNPTQQQTFINNLVSMYGEFSGIVQQNVALQAAVQQIKASPLPRANVTSPQPEGVLQSILDFFVPFLGPAQNASSCDLLVDSIPGNPNYGKYSFPMLASDDPDMQAFAQQMANASQGLFTQNDFLSNDSNAYTAYLWAADYMPTHQLSPGIGGCGQSTVQSLANVAVTSEIGQFTDLAGGTLVSQAGGGEIAQQIASSANDIAVGLMVDSSGNPNAVIGQMTPSQTIAAPAGTYNLAVSFGGDTANATLTNTPVYPYSITNISPSSGTAITVTPPYVTGLTPAIGIAGTAVVVTGTGFDPTASNDEVTFNGTSAQVDSATTASIQTSVPAGASSGPVSVTTNSGSTTSSVLFTVTGSSGNPPPAITSLFPNTATAGATSQLLSIGGTGFVPSSTVTFNGVSHAITFFGHESDHGHARCV